MFSLEKINTYLNSFPRPLEHMDNILEFLGPQVKSFCVISSISSLLLTRGLWTNYLTLAGNSFFNCIVGITTVFTSLL